MSKGKIIFGNDLGLTCDATIVARRFISVGNSVRITHNVQLIDTENHFLLDKEQNTIRDNTREIRIGNYCWIGNGTSVRKGVVLPDYTIVTSHSLLNKKYEIPQYSIIGGIPAKLLKTGFVRIWDAEKERQLLDYFEKNPNTFISGDNYETAI